MTGGAAAEEPLVFSRELSDESLHAKVPPHEGSLAGGAGQHCLLFAAWLADLVALQALHNLLRGLQLQQAHCTLWDKRCFHFCNLCADKILQLLLPLLQFFSQSPLNFDQVTAVDLVLFNHSSSRYFFPF